MQDLYYAPELDGVYDGDDDGDFGFEQQTDEIILDESGMRVDHAAEFHSRPTE